MKNTNCVKFLTRDDRVTTVGLKATGCLHLTKFKPIEMELISYL